ncbi:transposase [Priestia aryabhattai]|uniref:T7SS effector LXG polymorphic toxin n=1 Tax=Priestia TaxID=2800373 RepID=UPI000BF2A337|nr:T7SS effector LXG polymorphic toxin [Priestia aryabhattai]MBK0005261.1 AHH domain-containing protein [Bacillus sp. S35]MCM3641686.1 T7SS effector LXG polymorphic toxin [Priestia aryabhattai]PFW75409.1 transposase [Priestia aryabhattai]
MGKVYDAKALFDVAKDREKAYDELLSQLGELKKALQGVADLEGSLEGKGADNIKSFYKQHADTAGQWENLIKMQQSYFSTLHVKAEKAKLTGSTIVDESFLETELKNANSNAKEMVAQQHDDLQSILNGIDDIVSISAFSTSEFNDKIEEAEKKRTDTIEAVNQLDAEWSKEYSEMDDFYAVVDTLVSGLELATSQGGSVYQLAFDEKAYHDSELYKVQTKLNDYATSYVDYNKQQEEVYELEKKQEEEANKPWYEKTWDAVSTFTGEVSGYYDYKRAAEGVDPVTGEKLSTSQRVAAGAMAAAGFIPVVGWVGRAAKGGKAIYKTAKGLSAADHALDAYKSAKSFKVLEQTEKGLYGLVAANGLGEYMTGRDMFGNKISEEQRKASLLQALGIAGAGALSTKVAGKMGQSLATKGTEKLNNMRNTLRTSAVANVTKQAYQSVKNAPASWTQSLHKTYNNILDSSMPRLGPELAPAGSALAQQTVRETLQNVKKQTMQMIEKPVKVERVSERQIQTGTKGIDNANRLIPGTPGNPTSGDPTKLGKNLLESMGLPRSKSWKGYQAQHIIPSQLNKHPVIKKIGMEMNDSTNGIFLPIPSDDVSSLSRHRGFHSVYNNVVRKQLDKMDVNQDIAVLEKQVYELQQKLKKGVENGLPLYKTKINNIEEFYKSGKNKKLPVWNRGGGATEELWERWLSK